jgi:hypothetical protein
MAGQLNTDVAACSAAASSVTSGYTAGADIVGLLELLQVKAKECLRMATYINSIAAGADTGLAAELVTVLADLA